MIMGSKRLPGGPLQGVLHLVRGIVLDAVGTLIEARPSVAAAYAEAAEAQGVKLDRELVRARFRRAFAEPEVHASRGACGTDESLEQRRWRRIVTEVLPEVANPGQAFDDLWQHFADPAHWYVPDDAVEAVAALKDHGLPILVASNFDSRLRPVLAGLGPLAFLAESAVVSSEVGYCKPHPAFYRAVEERLGADSSATLWIGDTLGNDIVGPHEAGFQTALIDRRNQFATMDLPAGSIRVTDLRELAQRVVEARST